MINRWILRFKLWWYDVCPEHGPMQRGWFYDNTIELRFDVESHTYYLVGPLGELTALDGVFNGPEDTREDFHNPGGCA